MKTTLRGTIGLGAAWLLAGGLALAQGNPATSVQRDPTDPIAPTAPTTTDSQPTTGAQRSLNVGTTDTQVSSGTANDDTTTSQAATTQDDSPVSVAGRIDKVDRADDTIEIDGIDRQLKLDPSTRVTRGGAQASFSEIQEGEQVRASFDDGFPAHVRQIDIVGPRGSPGASGSTEPDSAPVGHPLPATPPGMRSGSQ